MLNENDLKQALLERAKAKNLFYKKVNNKKTTKSELLKVYKDYKKVNANFIKIYEGVSYDRAA